jgi:hypothetical protein
VRSAAPVSVACADEKKSWTSALWDAAKTKVRDEIEGALGTTEGVLLEAGSIVDTVAWVPYAEIDAINWAVDKTADASGISKDKREALRAVVHTVAQDNAAILEPIRDVAKSKGAVDPVTGAPAVSPLITKLGDAADKVISHVSARAGLKPEEGLLTVREQNQIAGAVLSQVALSFVGVEEVQLALKVVGGIGAAKAIVSAAEQDPKGFLKSKQFWIAVASAALYLIGLHASSAGKKLLTYFVDAVSLTLATAPPVIQLVEDLTNAKGPDRDEILHKDLAAVTRAAVEALRQIIQHAATIKKGRPAPPPQEPEGKPPAVPPAAAPGQPEASTAQAPARPATPPPAAVTEPAAPPPATVIEPAAPPPAPAAPAVTQEPETPAVTASAKAPVPAASEHADTESAFTSLQSELEGKTPAAGQVSTPAPVPGETPAPGPGAPPPAAATPEAQPVTIRPQTRGPALSRPELLATYEREANARVPALVADVLSNQQSTPARTRLGVLRQQFDQLRQAVGGGQLTAAQRLQANQILREARVLSRADFNNVRNGLWLRLRREPALSGIEQQMRQAGDVQAGGRALRVRTQTGAGTKFEGLGVEHRTRLSDDPWRYNDPANLIVTDAAQNEQFLEALRQHGHIWPAGDTEDFIIRHGLNDQGLYYAPRKRR